MKNEIVELAKLINVNLKHINEYRAKIAHEENELKNTIANITHDLRTPITSVLGYIQLLYNENSLGEKEARYIDIINSRVETLKQLIENLFSYSLIYDKSELLDIKSENINLILEDSIALYYNDLVEKNIFPVIELPNEPIYKNVDKLALKRVFNNLISNVIKYGKSLKVILNSDGVYFENSTENYDQIDVGKIFDRFFTVTRARNNNSMGLGLTITKNLVEKMNGTVSASLEKDILSIKIIL